MVPYRLNLNLAGTLVVWENIQGWGLKDSNNLKQCEKLNLNSTKTGEGGGHRKIPSVSFHGYGYFMELHNYYINILCNACVVIP